MPTANALGKKYCPQCGWNREAAEKQTRLLLRLLPVLVIVFDAPLIIWIFVGHAELPVMAALGVLAIVPAILVALVMRDKVRVAATRTPSMQSAPKEADAVAAPREAMPQEYKALAELPRPRPVRMSRQGKMSTAMISVSLLVFACVLVAMVMLKPASGTGTTPPRIVAFALPVVLIAVIAFVLRRSLAQQRWLLAEGDLAMARVTKQWTARNGSGIRYEFTMPDGELFSSVSADNSRQLEVGMSVPVFYDPEEPKKQVALSAAFYEVVMPGRD